MNRVDSPIGVFDSGVGGISTLKVLAKMLPHEDFVFFGDSGNAPYGEKRREEVQRLTNNAVQKLLTHHIKGMVIACNTATSASKPMLLEHYPDLTIVGIEPALKEAVDNGAQNILVMATPLTLAMPKFQRQLRLFSGERHIETLPCSGLAGLIECGAQRLDDVKDLLRRLLSTTSDTQFDAIVLGCTHYPFVKDLIAECIPSHPRFFTGYEGLTRHLTHLLDDKNLLRTGNEHRSIEFLSSSVNPHETDLYRELFTSSIESATQFGR
ncbi:MAG: glutamate racemase [Bifidobacterium aquikefiri]|uniref:Glutamate racemase n=1 Tax=Bifidobacterium aquikefiri TaxID=1653207 RepID=A0A261GAP2_9BIFI|nr:glutamate racemase [Bifidobacterium aquikefiri]OZG68488.1 glutamate racemase [Bifidobacterium aquikefiri]